MQDFIYVNCDNGERVPMRPVQWDKRVKGEAFSAISGGKKDMVQVVSPDHWNLGPDTFPINISVMGVMWEIQIDWEAEIFRIELEERKDRKARLQAQKDDEVEIANFESYDMAKYYKR